MAWIWVKSGLDKQILPTLTINQYINAKYISNVTIFNSNDTKKFFFFFFRIFSKFEEVGGPEFLELIQHTMDLFYLIKQ